MPKGILIASDLQKSSGSSPPARIKAMLPLIKRDHTSNIESVANTASSTAIDSRFSYLTCTKCTRQKNIEEFHKNPSKKSGRESHCKECIGKRKAKSYKNRKTEVVSSALRRAKTRVIDLNEGTISEVYSPSDLESTTSVLEDFIEAVICKSTK